ncbi:MAG: hypothetical protein K2G30_01165, partial [Muribaculaceae bacterium]|nr:hypothetical protein [Muribaculaceae bacterium]
TSAGKFFTFPIRASLCWDSVYGFCETPPADGVSVEVECGGEKSVIGEYPYEWSFARFQPSDKVRITVKVAAPDGAKTHEIEI